MPDARSTLLAITLAASACGNDAGALPPITATPAPAPSEQPYTGFAGETPVILADFAEDAMEPFISRDGRKLFFTRIADPANPQPVILRAVRADTRSAFDEPQRVAAITGFAEAPSLTDDGRRLYYHKRENGRYAVFLVTR